MYSSKEGLKYFSIAVASIWAFLPIVSLANPELVADLTPGVKSSAIYGLHVKDGKLEFSLGFPDSINKAYERHFTLDAQGNLSQSPVAMDDFELAIEYGDKILFADGDFVWALGPDKEISEIYKLLEDDEYWDGYTRHSVESFFIKDNELHLVLQTTYQNRTTSVAFKLVKLDVDTGDASVVADPYFPFGDPKDHPDINKALFTYQFNDTTYYTMETQETGQELWSIRGQGNNRELFLVADIKAGPKGSYPDFFTTFNNEMYFKANGPDGRELWKIDSSGNLKQVADINPKGAAFTYRQSSGYAEYNNELFFTAFEPEFGNELWKTDGTEAGTVMVSDVFPGKAGFSIETSTFSVRLQDANGFYFTAQGENEESPSIWLSDGTDQGIRRLLSESFKRVHNGFRIGDASYILTSEDEYMSVYSMWQLANGPTVEPQKLFDGFSYLDVWDAAIDNENFFVFAANEEYGQELWISDGSPAGTQIVKDIYPGAMGSEPFHLAQLNGKLLISANDGVSGREIWLSDGSDNGTVLLKDINPGLESSQPAYYGQTQSRGFFSAYTPESGSELWITDGTSAGTRLVKDINPGPANGTMGPMLGLFSGLLYFVGIDNVNGEELWVSDGTEAGTRMIGPIHPDTTEFNPDVEHPLSSTGRAIEFNGSVYFVQYSADYGTELWKYTPDTRPEAGAGALGDYVWMDNDGDGIQDTNESGLNGITVELQTCDGNVIAETASNDTGYFRFNSLAAGYYRLRFVRPINLKFSPEKSAGDYQLDSNADVTTGLSPCVDLTRGWKRTAIDAGMLFDD